MGDFSIGDFGSSIGDFGGASYSAPLEATQAAGDVQTESGGVQPAVSYEVPGATSGFEQVANYSKVLGTAQAPGVAGNWMINGTAPAGKNTIACDGSGGITPWLEAVNTNDPQIACLRSFVEKHEGSHAADALTSNPDICVGQPAGAWVTHADAKTYCESEDKAYTTEIGGLRSTIDQMQQTGQGVGACTPAMIPTMEQRIHDLAASSAKIYMQCKYSFRP